MYTSTNYYDPGTGTVTLTGVNAYNMLNSLIDFAEVNNFNTLYDLDGVMIISIDAPDPLPGNLVKKTVIHSNGQGISTGELQAFTDAALAAANQYGMANITLTVSNIGQNGYVKMEYLPVI